ncbi:MAG: hypothetical protein ACK5MV_05885 [Aminipila sp.]
MKARVLITWAVLLTLTFSFTACGDPGTKSSAKKINAALEKSIEIKSGSIETNILEGSYYPKDAPNKIVSDFENLNSKKEKDERNIEFDVTFYYSDREKEVSNRTNYEGLYLNVYYPYERYNKINVDRVEKIVSEKNENGTTYYVYYNGSHLSRREEWADCKVIKDFEYFFIDKEGIITAYTSETSYRIQDKDSQKWSDGKSRLSVKLENYEIY